MAVERDAMRYLIAAAGIAAAMTSLVSAELPQRYVVTVLEHPQGNDTRTLVPMDIDDTGRITGFAFHGFGADLTRQPFIWTNDAPVLVPVEWDYIEGHHLAHDGTAYGIDHNTDTIVHINKTGITPVVVASFGSSAGITHVTDTGHVMGLDGSDGFLWHASTGFIRFSELTGGIVPAHAADLTNDGTVIGTNGYNNLGSCRSFVWDGSKMIDPVPALSGATRGIALDAQKRLILAHAPEGFWPGGGIHKIYLATAHSDGFDPGTPVQTLPSAYNLDVVGNDAGVIAASWDTGNNDPRLLMTGPDGIDAVDLDIPAGMLAITLEGISDTGIAYGRLLDADYVTFGYVASASEGMRLLGRRLIGSPPLTFYGVASDVNASGAMIISWAHNYNYGHWALVEPAMPGDVDGDETVDITDVLDLIAVWGPQPADPVCGPDLNLDGTVGVDDLLEVLDAYVVLP